MLAGVQRLGRLDLVGVEAGDADLPVARAHLLGHPGGPAGPLGPAWRQRLDMPKSAVFAHMGGEAGTLEQIVGISH
ncbi:hypothetical protein GCM10009618_04140 [Nesterenkonia lacusekhoensis]